MEINEAQRRLRPAVMRHFGTDLLKEGDLLKILFTYEIDAAGVTAYINQTCPGVTVPDKYDGKIRAGSCPIYIDPAALNEQTIIMLDKAFSRIPREFFKMQDVPLPPPGGELGR